MSRKDPLNTAGDGVSSASGTQKSAVVSKKNRPPYRKAVGPRLHRLLVCVLALFALLAANSLYLGSITALESLTNEVYQDYFYLVMFLVHLVLGFLLILPVLIFGVLHMRNTFRRKNRRAVRVGYALFIIALLLLISGVLLVRITGVFDLKSPALRSVVYWVHVVCPFAAVWMYWLHRLAGPPIHWKVARGFGGIVACTIPVMVFLHLQDPRQWNVVGPASGEEYFKPSMARTSTGKFIPAESLMNDQYCLKCHADVHAGWQDSVHHFSSFNNPAYLASIRETRDELMDRDGSIQASRWCAGCHDPVPFFSGAFDDPQFDDVNHPTAHAGITCTVCHAITHANSTEGNADFTIEEPLHYPFAFSDQPALQWINQQLVKAKPSFHRKTFLKPFHLEEDFCSTCHKVSLPFALNQYKDFLRGQNHHDSYLLSGVSGHGARSFYYPDVAQTDCNGCHMPLQPSSDFGARDHGSGTLSVHDHLFPSANTAIAWWRERPEIVNAHQKFLEGIVRVDVFGIREGIDIDGPLEAPLRPSVPELEPGAEYLLETVIRTLKVGHHFTQGTTDSNEIWLDVTVRSGDRIIGRSGDLDENSSVDPWSHFVNTFMLDKEGNRIDRRNAQDIFTPLYSNQIPPGAGQTVHYGFRVPPDTRDPITVEVKLQYRKFDATYVDFIAKNQRSQDEPLRGKRAGEPYRNPLPITTLAADQITFPIRGRSHEIENPDRDIPAWERWNDYGIGLLLKGKSQLKQAIAAFAEVEQLGRYDGPLNMARALLAEGDVSAAVAALQKAGAYSEPAAPWWTLAYFNGIANRQTGRLVEAESNFRQILEQKTAELARRKFDFSQDYITLNMLGQTLFDRALQLDRFEDRKDEQTAILEDARDTFLRTLVIDSENVDAHYNLTRIFSRLGEEQLSEKHRSLHERYRVDDNARGKAASAARIKYPAAAAAAEAVVIHDLQRAGANE